MKLNAYILAGDPTWIERSVSSYYDLVTRIVVSYDESGRGWTGAPIDTEGCLQRLRDIDSGAKMVFVPGNFSDTIRSPMENDTRQRTLALVEAAENADWVLQLDTDEFLPNPNALLTTLAVAEELDIPAVEWPMRVLFRKLKDGRFLEVCARDSADRFEYPGPIAVRPGVRLVDARRTNGPFIRPVVNGDSRSLQIQRTPELRETRLPIAPSDAILHNSWGRDPKTIRRKIASWSHNQGWRTQMFYLTKWKPAPLLWPIMRDLHPFARGLWPALKPCTTLPAWVAR